MPSSYRYYAIDFSGNGKRDLFHSPADAIGSIANYLKKHGWQASQPIVERATLTDGQTPQTTASYKPSLTAEQLKKRGIKATKTVHNGTQVSLFTLPAQTTPEYWLGFQNFYAITRYNNSKLYAMAVVDLAESLQKAKEKAHVPS